MKIKKLTAFVLSDVIIGLVLVSALVSAIYLMMQDNDNLDMYAASCADESELYGHAIACGNVLYNNTGVLPNCDEIGDCVVNQAALTTKWPNLAKNDIASPTAVNLTFGDSGIDGVADDEVECSGSPVTLTLNCTDDRVGGAPAAAPTCTPLGATDTTCDGVDDNCSGTADDGYVTSGSCQVAGTNATCPAEEVTGSYICQSGAEVCDAGVLVATCPPVCGNGTQEAGEACDDGNLDPGDGCDENCAVEGQPYGQFKQEWVDACNEFYSQYPGVQSYRTIASLTVSQNTKDFIESVCSEIIIAGGGSGSVTSFQIPSLENHGCPSNTTDGTYDRTDFNCIGNTGLVQAHIWGPGEVNLSYCTGDTPWSSAFPNNYYMELINAICTSP